jgi:pSer/pThr/pTyr-binding forkhead associated (FHA) protein
VIACEVCGTDNDSKLTFCRTCGHRVKAKKARAVPPTPAIAAKKAELPSREPKAGDAWPADAGGAVAAMADVPIDDAPDGKSKCGQCGSLSPQGYRFCISCGAVLNKPVVPPAKPQATKIGGNENLQQVAPHQVAPHNVAKHQVAKHQVVKKAQPLPPEPAAKPEGEKVACKDCGGMCQGTESFCKFCGAPLAQATSKPPPPRSARPAKPRAKPVPKASPRDSVPVDLTDDVKPAEPFPLAASAEAAAPAAKAPRSRPPPKRQSPQKAAAPRADPKDQVSGRLVVIVEDGSEGKTLELRGRQVDIGSAEGDIILAEDRYLSPRHARFFRQDGHWYLRNLDSLNGVYRRLRKPVPLKDRDLVLLGLEVLEFQLVDHAERGLGHAIQHGVLVFGSPAATRRARLCQRTVEGVIRDVYHLVADETTVGRETGDIVFTSDPFMSRRHAAIQWDEDSQEYVLVDLNSSNGTYLAIRDDLRLDNGDFIRLGQHLFRVDLPQKPKR